MKLSTLTAFALVAALQPLCGESEPERELAHLTEQHDRALAAAIDPIDQLYRTALNQLLQKANDSGDLASAEKIKAAIARLQSGTKSPKAKPTTAGDLNAFLAGTVWNISDERPDGEVQYTLTFLKNGTFIHSGGSTGVWSAQSARDLKLWNWDPATLNEDLTQFRAVGTGVIYFGNLKK
jgi:hypothetical protein